MEQAAKMPAPAVLYSGRATGIAPMVRTLKLALWAALWLGIYWILGPANRDAIVAQTGSKEVLDITAAIDKSEYSKPAAEIGRLVMLGFAAIVGLKIAWTWAGWNATRYLVTSEKIQFERGVFAKTIKSIDLWRVKDLIFQRGVFESLCGAGSIMIVASDATSKYSTIGPVTGARGLYDRVVEARDRAIKERGVTAVET
ncbi:MAG: PH domain-containing protein [Phycisphaeraceae bacterium]|nr:MAG: PH domain-containing protein [Phycisphaeraceae bacterium]